MIVGERPSGNAAVARWGRRRLLVQVPVFVLLAALCRLGLRAVLDGGVGLDLVFLAAGPLDVWLFLRAWRERDSSVAFDATGVWMLRRGEAVPVRWDALAGIGIRSVGGGRGARDHLDLLFRDGNPVRSVDITLCRSECERALWRFAPQKLLCGEETRP